MTECQTLQPDWELDITTPHYILDLEFRKLGVESQFLDNTSIFPRRESGIVFGLGTCDYHFTRCEYEGGRFGISNTHDYSCESL